MVKAGKKTAGKKAAKKTDAERGTDRYINALLTIARIKYETKAK